MPLTTPCLACAAMEGGKPTIIPNAEGGRTTPSVVAFTKTGDRLVGQVRAAHHRQPDRQPAAWRPSLPGSRAARESAAQRPSHNRGRQPASRRPRRGARRLATARPLFCKTASLLAHALTRAPPSSLPPAPLQIAKRQGVVNPENTFFSVKRFIGRKMGEVGDESKQVGGWRPLLPLRCRCCPAEV